MDIGLYKYLLGFMFIVILGIAFCRSNNKKNIANKESEMQKTIKDHNMCQDEETEERVLVIKQLKEELYETFQNVFSNETLKEKLEYFILNTTKNKDYNLTAHFEYLLDIHEMIEYIKLDLEKRNDDMLTFLEFIPFVSYILNIERINSSTKDMMRDIKLQLYKKDILLKSLNVDYKIKRNEHLSIRTRLEELLKENELIINSINKFLHEANSHKNKDEILELTYMDRLILNSDIDKIENSSIFLLENDDSILNEKLLNSIDTRLDILMLDDFIEKMKFDVYTKDVKQKIQNSENVISKYVEMLGDNSKQNINIVTLSKIINQPENETLNLVNDEYLIIEKEREENEVVQKLENLLFPGSSKNINYIDSLSEEKFEDYLIGVFQAFGYQVISQLKNEDYGADLIINKGFNKIIIKVKIQNDNLNNDSIQQVFSAKSHYDCDTPMVITNSHFTKTASTLANSNKVILVNRDDLIQMVENGDSYFSTLLK